MRLPGAACAAWRCGAAWMSCWPIGQNRYCSCSVAGTRRGWQCWYRLMTKKLYYLMRRGGGEGLLLLGLPMCGLG